MAKARMLHKKISVSLQVNKLPLPARLLFTWMIAHADDDGRMRGEPEHIKASVVPLTKWSFKRVECYLEEMDTARLIHWWTNPKTGDWFVEFVNWKKYQTLKSDRYKESDLPSFGEESGNTTVPSVFQDGTRMAPQSNISELSPIEVNKRKDKEQKKYLDTLKKEYSSINNISEEDISEIALQYKVPIGFVQLQLEVLRNYCSSKGKKYQDYKAALRNFVLREAKSAVERRALHGNKRGIDATGI